MIVFKSDRTLDLRDGHRGVARENVGELASEIGREMDVRYRETAGGGLAATPTGRRLAKERLRAIRPEVLAELKDALKKGSRGSRVDVVIEEELADSEDAKLGPFVIEGAW